MQNTRKDMRRKNKKLEEMYEMKMQEIETVQEEKLIELKGFFEKEKQELEEDVRDENAKDAVES